MKVIAYPATVVIILLLATLSLKAQTLVNRVQVDTLSHAVAAYNYMATTKDGAGGHYLCINKYTTGVLSASAVLHQTSGGVSFITILNDNSTLQSYIAGICYVGSYVYVTGLVLDTNNTSSIYTVKLNSTTGDTVWTRTYAGAYAYAAGAAVVDDDSGNVYVCGTEQTATGYRMDLLKYNGAGTRLFLSYYDSTGLTNGAVGMALNPGSNIAITGYSGTGGFSSWDFATAWFGLGGGTPLSVARSTNGNGFSQPVAILRDDAQNILVVGTAATTPGSSNIKMVQYDSTFTQTYSRTFGDSTSVITARRLPMMAITILLLPVRRPTPAAVLMPIFLKPIIAAPAPI